MEELKRMPAYEEEEEEEEEQEEEEQEEEEGRSSRRDNVCGKRVAASCTMHWEKNTHALFSKQN